MHVTTIPGRTSGNAGKNGRNPRWLSRVASKAPIYWRDVRTRPGWLLMFVFARVLLLRRAYVALWRRWAPPEPSAATGEAPAPAYADAEPRAIAATVRDTGLWEGLRLPADTVAAIGAFAETRPCFAASDRRLPFLAAEHEAAERDYGRSILTGHFLDTVLDCEAARAVIESPWLHAIAASYLRGAPFLIASRLWWSFASPAASRGDLALASQSFHYDLDDWHQLKIFFYLTDVGEAEGPHVYVRGSHRTRPLSYQLRPFVGLTETDAIAAYGSEAITAVVGAAGTGFVEDPFGMHMGVPVAKGRRLALEVSYGTADWIPNRRYGEFSPR
jgi:hypothetical protein